MPADTPGKPSASPLAGAPASASRTPDKPRSAAEHRRSSKPIMEKRRRARINQSLAQLKTIILDAVRKDVSRGRAGGIEGLRPAEWGMAELQITTPSLPQSSRHSKLEKADILEMTVTHLQNLRRLQVTAALSADPAVLGKYRAGFNECLVEVTRFLAGCEGVRAEVRSRLLGHLAACLLQLGSSHSPASLPAAAEDQASEVFAGCRLLRSFDGLFPLLRPAVEFAPLLPPGPTPAPPAAPRVGPQGRDGPWRPWLQ